MYNPITPYVAVPGQTVLTDLLIEAMKDEKHDREKYRIMMDMTKSEKIKKQIEFAFKDEGKHYKMFREILYCLTGRLEDVPDPDLDCHEKFIEAVESSINGELEAVELYRKIKAMLPNIQMRDMLYEIITDEQEHADRFIYIYAILTHHHDS